METLRTPFNQDIPQSFLYRDAKGKTHMVGAYGKLIHYFAKYHNYELQLDPVDNPKLWQIQKKIEQGIYNLSMKAETYNNLFANVTFSYPLEWSKSCIMVPTKDELPRYWYVVWPFGTYIWTLLHLAVFYVALCMRCLKHPSSNFAQNLLSSLAVVFYSSNMNLKIVNVSSRVQLFYFLLLILGFILNSFYCSFLAMYHMRPIFQPAIRTIDDILASNIKILVPSHVFEGLRNARFLDLSRLEPVLVEKPQLIVRKHVQSFDRAFAYIINRNEWDFTAKLQRNLIQPLFQLSHICTFRTLNSFPMKLESKFANALNLFILRVHQSGLWMQWQEEAFLSALWAKYFRMLADDYPADPLNINYFRFAWAVFIVGIVSSCLCFVAERTVFKYKNKV